VGRIGPQPAPRKFPSTNVDTSIFKNTKITERVTLRIEADAFNVLNRSYYSAPDNFIGDASSGSSTTFSLIPLPAVSSVLARASEI